MKINNITKTIIGIGIAVLPFNSYAYTKEEIVFTSLSNTGNVKENIVNTHLKYTPNEDFSDETILKDILNISGKEKYENQDGKLVWKGKGKDITYQGTTDKELPISVNIKYYLDGKEISKKKLLNKKGNVKIEVSLKNNAYNNNYKLYTPFVVTLASIFKDDCSNISINNGKVVNTGNNNIVVGIASPGMYDNLNLSEFKDLDKIVINYDTSKFKSNDLYIVATPKILETSDLDVFNKIDNASNDLRKLQDGVNSLQEGSNKLVEGTTTLSDGITKAYDGSTELMNGLTILNNNTLSISKMTVLVNSLYEKYNENKAKLQLVTSGQALAQYNAGLDQVNVTLTDLNTKKTAYENLKALVDANGIDSLPAEQQAQYTLLNDSIEEIEAGIVECNNKITEINTEIANLPNVPYIITGANMVIEQTLSQILGIEDLSDDNKTQVAITMFNTNILNLVGGVNKLRDGSVSLNNGLKELNTGGINLKNGTIELRDGIVKLNNEGISKITNLTNKLSMYSNKVKNLTKATKEYKGYSANNSDEVLFIYKVGK